MSVIKPWAQALNVNINDLETWKLQVPKDESLTFWCLEKGKIQLREYLNWASSYYGLAIVSDEYFKTPMSRNLWRIIESVANWSPTMLPIEEWDGVIFIACVEPPTDIHWSFPVQYVLASPFGLKERWRWFHSAEKTAVGMEVPNLNAESNETQIEINKELTPPHSTSTPHPKPIAPPARAQKLETPPAIPSITLEPLKSTTTKSEQDALPPAVVHVAGESPESSIEMPEGLSIKPKKSILQIGDEPEGLLNTSKETPTPTSAASKAGFEALAKSLEPTVNSEQVESEQVESEQVESEQVDFNQDDIPTKKIKNLLKKEGNVVSLDQAPANISEAKSEDQAAAWAFQQLKSHFVCSMLLRFEGEELRVWKWENLLNHTTTKALKPFDVQKPGLFRVVLRTQHPYHGHVVESPLHNEFFQDWGFRKLPSHVTALPIKRKDQLEGVLLCIGDESANTPQSLLVAEKTALRLMQHLESLDAKAA